MAEEYETIVDIPHISYPPVDFKTGLWTPVWYEVQQRLWERTGGDVDLINQNSVDITNKADKSIQIIAGDGLDGGGTLAANITIDVNIDDTLDLVGAPVTGSLLVRGVAAWQLISPGTSGYTLTSNGAGLLPTYQNSGGRCLPVVIAPTGILITDQACGTVFQNGL